MKCEAPKRKRKVKEIQRLKKELIEQKKKVAVLQQQQTVKLDENQMQAILDKLTDRIDKVTLSIETTHKPKMDGFSQVIKNVIAALFLGVAATTLVCLFLYGGESWAESGSNKIAMIGIGIASISCGMIGIEILKEKDRKYIISLFSALVALVALIVSIVK